MSARIRAVAVDDEPLALRRIRKALERHPDVELVAEIGDGDSAAEELPALRPDLLFLDIRMPGRDGFEVLAALPPEDRPLVVFVTAYDDHALGAFRVHAADYLVKPFDDARFDEMMSHVRTRLQRDRASLRAELQGLLTGVGAAPAFARRIRVSTDQRTQFVPVTSIRYLQADGNYVVIHATDGEHRIRARVSELHERLDPGVFVRIHRGTVLNLEFLREIQPWFSGDYVAILDDGEQLRISRRYRDDIMRLSI
ncbi:MAG TPA: LytTR family DNA-binding domain-containing protein [Longimicrobiales bacterium]|nr:LytTR family DNA-binding domain-containing protein [Longimicrobiales bacterium]